MGGIAILFTAAAVAYAVAQRLNLPVLPLLLVAGLGLYLTGALPADLLEQTLILGTTFLLFVNGIELNPRHTRAQRLVALRVGVLQFLLLGAAGYAASRALGFSPLDALYLSLGLAASSTLVVLRLLQQRRQLFEPFGRLVVGVLLFQDLLVLLLIPLVTRLPQGLLAVAEGMLATLTLGGLAWIANRLLTPWLVRLDDEEEPLLLTVLGVLFVFVGLANALGLPLLTGAFLAGVTLSSFPVSGMVRARLHSIGEFFSALFFLSLGALIGLPTLTQLLSALALALLVILLTPPLVTFIAERAGMSARPAIESGLLLAQTSEISLVIALFGMVAGQIDAGVFTVIALVTLLTMVVTPFLSSDRIAWMIMRLQPNRRDSAAPALPTHDHVLILGSGATGMPLLETLLASGNEILVIDDDPVVIARLREAEIACLRGDASDSQLLRRAGAHRARAITSTIRRPEDNRRLLEVAAGVPVLIRVFEADDAEWIRALGGIPILASDAAADELMRWFDREFAAAPTHRDG